MGPGLGTSWAQTSPLYEGLCMCSAPQLLRNLEDIGSPGARGWKLPVETTARPATAARLAPPRSQRVIREVGLRLGTTEPWVDHAAQKPSASHPAEP